MSSGAVYDDHVEMYLEFVDRALHGEPSLFGRMLEIFVQMLGLHLNSARVLDIACGEGYLSRFLAEHGAKDVTGIDISSALIEVARERSPAATITFHVDDATKLATVDDDSIDVAVSQMAIMDVADHVAMLRAVHRVLRPRGRFVFSMLHPCFEGPYDPPDQDPLVIGDASEPIARVVWRYATEGHWRPATSGVRSHVGSYHRTLSTYVNALVSAGFRLDAMEEPVFEGTDLFSEVPRVMIISATAL